MCDYKKIRDEKIKGCKKIADSKMHFYYDETENFGKMRINLDKDLGYNKCPASPAFMVDGLWCRDEITNDMAQELINATKVKTGLNKVKFKNVFGKKCDLKGIF